MSNIDEAITYVFTWHALSDACRVCRGLNGYEFHDQDLFQERLWSPIWGDVWDLNANHSLAHGVRQYNCRCQLEVRVEFNIEEVEEWNTFLDLMETVKNL